MNIYYLTMGFLLMSVLVSSILDLWIWKDGTTHWPQEHCSPTQLKEPRRALHLGQRICMKCVYIQRKMISCQSPTEHKVRLYVSGITAKFSYEAPL